MMMAVCVDRDENAHALMYGDRDTLELCQVMFDLDVSINATGFSLWASLTCPLRAYSRQVPQLVCVTFNVVFTLFHPDDARSTRLSHPHVLCRSTTLDVTRPQHRVLRERYTIRPS